MDNQATILPFKLPEGIMDGDPTIANQFDEYMRVYSRVKEIEEDLKTQKQILEALESDLVLGIKTTGGVAWEREKGMKAEVKESHYWNFSKAQREDFFDWLEMNGYEDLLTVNDKSLGGAIRNRWMEEQGIQSEDEAAEQLPDFITHYKKEKISVHHTALKKWREKYL